MLWTGAALVVPTVEVISGQSEFMIPCTATAAAVDTVRSYYWLFNGTFVHMGAAVRSDGGLQFSEIRPEQTGNRNLGPCRDRLCKPFKELRNRFPVWRAGTTLIVVQARQATFYIGWRNGFLGSLNVYKYGLWYIIRSTVRKKIAFKNTNLWSLS